MPGPAGAGAGARGGLSVALWGLAGAVASGILHAFAARMVALICAQAFMAILAGVARL